MTMCRIENQSEILAVRKGKKTEISPRVRRGLLRPLGLDLIVPDTLRVKEGISNIIMSWLTGVDSRMLFLGCVGDSFVSSQMVPNQKARSKGSGPPKEICVRREEVMRRGWGKYTLRGGGK